MTDKQLADAAVVALRATTVSYPDWQRKMAQGKYPDVTQTNWWRAFDALGKIGVTAPPASDVVAKFPADLAALHATLPAGSTVLVPAGDNGNQALTLDKPMVFKGAPGARLGDVAFACGSGHIELRDIAANVVTVGPWQSAAPKETPPPPANNIVLANVKGVRWNIHWARTITVRDGDWGNVAHRCQICPIQPWDGNNAPTDILVDGGLYHDFGPSSPSLHTEGILIYGGNGVTVRGARFARIGGTGDIGLFFVDAPGVAAADFALLANITIEGVQGSQYWQPSPNDLDAYFNMQISNAPPIPGLALRGNTLPKTAFTSNGGPFTREGINWFPRPVPGGVPRSAVPPAGWGR